MNKKQFIKLFELEKIYQDYKNNIPFGFGLLDHLDEENQMSLF